MLALTTISASVIVTWHVSQHRLHFLCHDIVYSLYTLVQKPENANG